MPLGILDLVEIQDAIRRVVDVLVGNRHRSTHTAADAAAVFENGVREGG